MYTVSQKIQATFILIVFTVKFRMDLQRKELKLPPPLKSVATLPCET